MDKLIAVIKREYLERVRSKWFVVATIFGPLLMTLLVVVPAYLAQRSRGTGELRALAVVDASGDSLGAPLALALRAAGASVEVEATAPGALAAAESTLTRRVMAGTLEGYVVVDRLTAAGERARYAGRNASSIPDMEKLRGALRQAVLARRYAAAGLDAARIRALSDVRLSLDTERITERGRGGGGVGALALGYAVALLLYMSIVLYGQSILMGVIEEKSQRVAEVVVAAVPAETLLAGKVIGVGGVGMTQQLVWVASAVGLLRFQEPLMKLFGLPPVPLNLPHVSVGMGIAYLGYYVLGFALFTALFAAVGSMVSSTQDAQQVSTPLMLLIIPSMVLLGPVLMSPNGTLARVTTLVPFSSPILMPVRMSVTAVPWYELAGSVALLLVTCVGALWLAGRIYRVGILMYGKKPTLGELVHWVRQAG